MARTCAILINYHASDKTGKCLHSLMDQGIDTIYLVDNSVSREEAARLEGMVQDLPDRMDSPVVSLLINDSNLGFGKAINRAIRHDLESRSGHDYYILINNDAVAEQGMCKKLTTILERERDISLVSPLPAGRTGNMPNFWYNRLVGAVTLRKTPMAFPYLSGCCLAFRRDLVEREPLFDEDFFMYGEDAFLSWRLQSSGRKIRCTGEARVIHEGTGSSSHGGLFYEYHMARCHMLLAVKTWDRIYELPLFILGRLLFLSARAVVRSIRYATLTPVLALCICMIPLGIRPEEK